jgi:hypothetical protein
VFGGLNRLLPAAFVAGAFLALPAVALACPSGTSAVSVYSECVPTGGGGKSTHTSGKTTAVQPSVSVGVTKRTKKALRKAGTDRVPLKNLVRDFGTARLLQSSSVPTSEPTAIGSAFDLGSGPTALLVVLVGSAVLLLAATSARTMRHRRR